MNGAPGETVAEDTVVNIVRALEVIYDPRSSNEGRKNATVFLDKVKETEEAPIKGFQLANDATQPASLRHFGLSLLEHALKYRWDDYVPEQTQALRQWIIQLAQQIAPNDPAFLRHKVSQLWVQVTERSWLVEWRDMDQLLCELWEGSATHRDFVLQVLENLLEEIFSKEDSMTRSSNNELGAACIEIFIPSESRTRNPAPASDYYRLLRGGTDGWLHRLLQLLRDGREDGSADQMETDLMTRTLAVIRTAMPWLPLHAVVASQGIRTICQFLSRSNNTLQAGAVEVLHVLYHRSGFSDEDVRELVRPLFSSEGLALMRSVYDTGRHLQPIDLDEEKYATMKKFAEMLCALGLFLERKGDLIDASSDLSEILRFYTDILQHPSLVVSVPVLYLWTVILHVQAVAGSDSMSQLLPKLLGFSSQRLLRYEALPPDCEDPTFLFLIEDFETIPERHAFIGNYRRLCASIIEQIVRRKGHDPIHYIVSQADIVIRQNAVHEAVAPDLYRSNSLEVLRIDAQTVVLSTATKAFTKFLANKEADSARQGRSSETIALQERLEEWCASLLHSRTPDPIIQRLLLQTVVGVCQSCLSGSSRMPLEICEFVLSFQHVAVGGLSPYDEAVKELQAAQPKELQRLASAFYDQFASIYDDIKNGVDRVVQLECLSLRAKLDYKALLFIIVQKAHRISDTAKKTRLQDIVRPTMEQWQDNGLEQSLSTFDQFCDMLRIKGFADYFLASKAHQVEDWSARPLTQDGINLRSQIENQPSALPLQSTRSLFSAATDRTATDSRAFAIAKSLFTDCIPMILPNLLKVLSFVNAFTNPATWLAYPPQIRDIIERINVDRVWQSGISSESRDEFYDRVRNSKDTLEGLASAVRGATRNVRETCYWILHCMTLFGDAFYSHANLPEPLTLALYTDAHTLPLHQFSALLKLSTALVEGCPSNLRMQFLPSVFVFLFKQLEAKLTSAWDATEARHREIASDDLLDQEMKTESVLRNLTHSAVLTLSSFLDFSKTDRPNSREASAGPSIRTTILSSTNILEPLLLFCTHALRMHDHRSCAIVTRILRNLAPEFVPRGLLKPSSPPAGTDSAPAPPAYAPVDPHTASLVREFLCADVLKAAITSLHEPYFADLQKDLASLIAVILALFTEATQTPRSVLLSLPDMHPGKVDRALARLRDTRAERAQRAVVLALLEGVRGVSIYEMGKVARPSPRAGAAARSAMQEHFTSMNVDEERPAIARGGSPELGGVSELFG